MPTYEYRCRACDEHLEVVQAFTDDPLRECPACGGELRKVFGSIGITFKGSGFYKTDNRSSAGGSKGAKSTDSATSGSESSSSSDSSSSESSSSSGTSSTSESKSKSA